MTHSTRIRTLETRLQPVCADCQDRRLTVTTVHHGAGDGDTTPVPDDARCHVCGRHLEALTIVIRRVPSGAISEVHDDAR